MPTITIAAPIASAIVNGSPKIETARAIVTNGEMVAIIEVVWGVVRERPALTKNEGITVAKIAQPADSQKKRGLEEKSNPRLTTIK